MGGLPYVTVCPFSLKRARAVCTYARTSATTIPPPGKIAEKEKKGFFDIIEVSRRARASLKLVSKCSSQGLGAGTEPLHSLKLSSDSRVKNLSL